MIKFSGKEWIFSDNDSDPASIVCLTVANIESKVFSVEGDNLSVDIHPYETKTLCTELSQYLREGVVLNCPASIPPEGPCWALYRIDSL